MKNFKRIGALLAVIIMIAMSTLPCFAAISYTTHTYSIKGQYLNSPDAYTPYKTYHSSDMGLTTPFDDPKDIFVDDDMNVYLADAANNRILVFSEYMTFKFEIKEFTNNHGVPDSLSNPSGVFVSDKYIYVADTDKNRVVLFNLDGTFHTLYEAPKSDVFPEGSIFKPIALAVDNMDRCYVVSSTTYMGIVVFDDQGQFTGFVGTQASSGGTAFEMAFNAIKSIATKTTNSVATEYNNIAIDYEGMIYCTTTSIDEGAQLGAITSKEATYAPVKKLNANGDDIMARNGFFAPCGEVVKTKDAVSKIVDVACGPEETFSIIDNTRQKIYTYDNEGNLLFAFGDVGTQLGNLVSVCGICYQGTKILVLDNSDDSITVFNRTEYGDTLITALAHNNNREYDKAIDDYKAILEKNNNFDTAYVGIGTANYRDGNWTEAMKNYKYAFDTTNYSNAFKNWRKEWIAKYVLVIPVVIIAFFFILAKFLGYSAKVNKRTALSKTKRTYKQELLYANHLIFHPFDGFWDLKHEKRGSVRAAVTFIVIAIVAFTYQAVGRSYLINPENDVSSVLIQIVGLVVPILLWVAANWCLTTLFEGEGSFRDVFVAVGYSLAPLPLFIIISTVISNFLTLNESSICTLLQSVAWVWVGFLVFIGMMITHDYSLGKNIITCVGTIVGMAFIIFVVLLFSTLLIKIVSFISNIVLELSYRV